MPPLDYLALRLVRRWMPARVMDWIMRQPFGPRAGLETRDPASAAERYRHALARRGWELAGRRMLILGYGGSFGLAVSLLEEGAAHVVLVDPYAVPKEKTNLALARAGKPYLQVEGGRAVPDARWITVVESPIEAYADSRVEPLDLVLSSSVYEHLHDPLAVTRSLAPITAPDGAQMHFIDLRDHYFKRPFEMLCYSDWVWRNLLNPGSNLNRWRAWEYERMFARVFPQVEVEVLERDSAEFGRARERIRPQFLSGERGADAVTKILVWAQRRAAAGSAGG